MDIRTIGVVGAGTMGSGIAHIAAMAGYDVILRDIEMAFRKHMNFTHWRVDARMVRDYYLNPAKRLTGWKIWALNL